MRKVSGKVDELWGVLGILGCGRGDGISGKRWRSFRFLVDVRVNMGIIWSFTRVSCSVLQVFSIRCFDNLHLMNVGFPYLPHRTTITTNIFNKGKDF